MKDMCKKMNKHVFDGENIVGMKDVYENFTLIFKATISQYEDLLSKAYIWGDHKFHKLTNELGFLITFSRCMLKRCVEESTTGPVINTGLIDILTDVESHFVDLLECCSRLLSKRRLSYSEGIEVLSMGSFEHMLPRVSNAFVDVFSANSSLSSTGLIHNGESMVEFLDELLKNLNQCDGKDKNIKNCIKILVFLRNYLQVTKEYWVGGEGSKEFLICVEVVAEIAACYSFLKKYGEFSSPEQYFLIKNHVESEMGIAALKALGLIKLQDSTDCFPPLTDGILKGYVDCVQKILRKLINDDEATETITLGISDLLQQAHLLKDHITDIVLFGYGKKEREMKGHSTELDKRCTKMLKHVFDGEKTDLSQEMMKDVYENFMLVFKTTISQHEKFESQAYSDLRPEFSQLRKELGFLITFTRCMLKRCMEEGAGVINRSLIDILTDVESHFVDLLEHCSILLSRGRISITEDKATLSMGRFEHMVLRVSDAYLAVFGTDSLPSSTGFMHNSESMVEFLDQLLQNLNQCDMEDKIITTYVEKLEFLRNYLQFTREYCTSGETLKEYLICLEAVAESAACYSFLKKYVKFSSSEDYLLFKDYLQFKNRVESEMGIPVLKLLGSTDNLPPLTDNLLKVYVDFVQEILTKLRNDDEAFNLMTLQEKNQFDDLHKMNFQFLVCLFLNYPLEELTDMRRQFQILVGNVGSLVLLSFNENTMAIGTTTLGISDMLQQAYLLKDRITDVILFADTTREREMKGRSLELEKVCKKMHKHVFDGKNMDLLQVMMKDVYENFTLIYKATVTQFKRIESQVSTDISYEFLALRKELGFLLTFSRCMVKRCVEEVTWVINRSLIDILTDIESHFVYLLGHCSRLLSRGGINGSKAKEILAVGSFEHIVSRVSNAFLDVFCIDSSPSSMCFMHSDELMVEFLDQLLEDLNQCDMEDKFIKASVQKLEFLRNYLRFTKEYRMSDEGLKEILTCVEVVAESTAYFSVLKRYGKFSFPGQYLQIKNRVESELGIAVLKALVLMKLQNSTHHLPLLTHGLLKGYMYCLQEIIEKLITDDEVIDRITPQVKDQFEDLFKDLEFLMGLIHSHSVELEKLRDIRTQYQTLVEDAGSFLFSFLNEEMRVNVAAQTSILEISQDFLEKARLLSERINHFCWLITFGRIGQNSSQIDQLGFLSILIDNLREFKDFTSKLKGGEFQAILEDLVLLRSFLQNTHGNNSTANDDESKEFLNLIRCAASEAEHFINSYVAEDIPDCCRLFWFSEFKQQMKLIKSTFVIVSEKKPASVVNNIEIVASSKNPVQSVPTNDVVVGFEDEMEILKERLVSDAEKLDVISIIGMAGLGKTTFAKKLYEDPSIIDHFELRGWCCVSQEYHTKELLLTILGCITRLTDDAYRRSEGDLSKMLHQHLTGNRYLIVMDDMWGMDALKYLKRFFPDNRNGSRILLTSRNKLEDYSNPLELPLLTDEESWNLLKQKIYQNEECPLQLRQVGEKIAEKCRGLPLAIVVVAGILAKSERKREFWEKVAENLSLYISGDTTQAHVMAVLELSYKLLPDNLKPLFLYLGAFPEDTEIPANKLAWLWIVEGFVQKTDQLTISLEVQAELNLMDLIDRSLVMIAERTSDGRVKSCRVHDLLRDMSLAKAEQENFMRMIKAQDESRNHITYERRLSTSLMRGTSLYLRHERTHFPTCRGLSKRSIAPPLSSFLFFNMNKTIPLSDEDIVSIFRDFRLLRILHSESITIDENIYRDHVVKLVHLRYISIRTDWNSIPSSISKLLNLQTLVIKGFGGQIAVPEEIWELVKLRHLHIKYRANFNGALLDESCSKLENLQTLSTPIVFCGKENELIARVPNLRKFGFISVEAKNSSYQLPQLESLNQLESLKILCDSRVRVSSGQFGFPSSLKKLTLSKFRLRWSEISSFGQKLPNLEVLKLHDQTFPDALWDMEDVVFSKLKLLKLESINLKEWIVSPDNFPCLQNLVFQSCYFLEEIPSSVGEFYSLEKLEVLWCSVSAASSAKQIQEDQKDMGNELLKVQINMYS